MNFSRWLGLLICLQMTWTRLKKELKGKNFPFVYIYEERYGIVAASLEYFTP